MIPLRFDRLAGLAGLGFVLLLLVANVVLTAAGFPTPSEAADTGEITAVFATGAGALRLASALLPAAWLLATVFAAGVCAALWRSGRARAEAWALVGLAGVLMQSAVFTGVEASRLAVAAAAVHAPGAVPGLWGLYNALFGFNQVFLATALLGLSLGGLRAGAIRRWLAVLGVLAAALLFASATASPFGEDGANPLAVLGLAGWLLWLVWIVGYSIALIRGIDDRAATSHSAAFRAGTSRAGSSHAGPSAG